MKKQLTLFSVLFFIFQIGIIKAQLTQYDFESGAQGFGQNGGAGTAVVQADNPSVDGVNGTAKALEITVAGGWGWAVNYWVDPKPNTNDYNTIELLVYASVTSTFQLRFEGSDGGNANVTMNATGATSSTNTWEKLTFEIPPGTATDDYRHMVIEPKAEGVFYIDNITFVNSSLPDPTSVTISPDAVTLIPGKKLQLESTFQPTDCDKSATYLSDNTGAATVDPTSGIVTSVASGSANITIASDVISSVTDDMTVTVEDAVISNSLVYMNFENGMENYNGDWGNWPENKKPVTNVVANPLKDAVNGSDKVYEVDSCFQFGAVSFKAANMNKYNTVKFKVFSTTAIADFQFEVGLNDNNLTKTNIPSSAGIAANTWTEYTYTADIYDAQSREFYIKLKSAGSKVATTPEGYKFYIDDIVFIAGNENDFKPITSISINESEITADNGKLNLTASILPANATNTNVTWSLVNASANVNDTVIFESNPPSLTAVRDGKVTVQVYSQDGGFIAQKEITISNQGVPVDSLKMEPTAAFPAAIAINGGKLRIDTITNIYPSDATNAKINWSLKNNTFNTISASGEVEAFADGEVWVMAVSDSNTQAKDSVKITISNQQKATAITVAGENNVSSIDEPNGTLQMIANVNPTSTRIKDVIWSLSKAGVVTINSSGLLTGIADGTVTVKATAIDGSNVFGEQAITVTRQIPDDIAPSKPIVLANKIGQDSVELKVSNLKDNVGVVKYRLFQVGVSDIIAGDSVGEMNDTIVLVKALIANSKYEFYAIAFDAENNYTKGDTLKITTTDEDAPSKPTGLLASNIIYNAFDIKWNKSVDNSNKVAKYELLVNESIKLTVTDTLATISGLTHSTTYSVKVKAYDATGNASLSEAIDVTTPVSPDNTTPVKPDTLITSKATQTSVVLHWSKSADDSDYAISGMYQYKVTKIKANDTTEVFVSANDTSYFMNSLMAGNSYSFFVNAIDSSGNISEKSPMVTVTLPDSLAPIAPTNLYATSVSNTQATVKWDASTDNSGSIHAYLISNYSNIIDTVKNTEVVLTGLVENALYKISVQAVDAVGNVSAASDTLELNTNDASAPEKVTGLEAINVTNTTLTLSWDDAVDNSGVISTYFIYQDFEVISQVSNTTLEVENLVELETYSYVVTAMDPSGNISVNSDTLMVTMLDLTAPEKVTGLVADSLTNTSVKLNWNVASDNSGTLQKYLVYVNDSLVAEPTDTLVKINNLTDLTAYSIVVKAVDNADNTSLASDTLIITTPDQTAPDKVSVLLAENIQASSLRIKWNVSLDNSSAKVSYIVYQDGDSIIQTNDTALFVEGLKAATAYKYEIVAVDTTGNISELSDALVVTTEIIKVVSIALSGDDITVNSGTSQITATIEPTNATVQDVTWSVSDNSVATIDANGLLTAIANGTVTVTATSTEEGSTVSGTLDINISGQGTLIDVQISNELKVYPNPATTSITINNDDSIEYISILSVIGNEVIRVNKPNENYMIDIQDLNEGMYFVKVYNGNHYKTVRFLKK